MTRRWSIAFRLALWLSVGLCLFWTGAAVIASTVLRSELERAFDNTLQQSAIRLLPLALRDAGEAGPRPPVPRFGPGRLFGPQGGPPSPPPAGPVELDTAESFTYLVFDRKGEVVVRAEDAPETLPANVAASEGFSFVDGHRAYVSPDRRNGRRILVLETTDARSRALWDAVAGLFWPLAALLPLMAIGIWLAVRAAMRPVNRLSEAVAQRNSANLAPLRDDDQPTELAPIAREVAGLIDRLRAAMEAERAFAASSAHELRTPIAGALAQTQRLAAELGPHPSASRVRDVEHALRHLSELSEALLQLSRLEAGFARADTANDLRPVLELVLRDFASTGQTAGRIVANIDPAAELAHAINPDAFAIAVRNLVQNAVLHGAPDLPVEVMAGPGPAIRVRNHGPVVPPETLARLHERFERGATKAKGTGLGLAVVDAIMAQTGGRLVLHSPASGWADGFEAVLELGD